MSSLREVWFFSICFVAFLCRALVNGGREVSFALFNRSTMEDGENEFLYAGNANAHGCMYSICKCMLKIVFLF